MVQLQALLLLFFRGESALDCGEHNWICDNDGKVIEMSYDCSKVLTMVGLKIKYKV